MSKTKRVGLVKANIDMKRQPGAMNFPRGLKDYSAKRGGTAGHYALVPGLYVRRRVLILI